MRGTQPHYENGKDYDIIDVIRDYELNFCRGNILSILQEQVRNTMNYLI